MIILNRQLNIQKKMAVTEIYLDEKIQSAEEFNEENKNFAIFTHSLVVCNDSKSTKIDKHTYCFDGDPTETAVAYFSSSKGIQKETIDKLAPRISEIPFDSKRNLMSTINQINGIYRVVTKGAPEALIGRCTRILLKGEVKTLTRRHRNNIIESYKIMANETLRILAIAINDIIEIPQNIMSDNTERDMVFVGLVGMN